MKIWIKVLIVTLLVAVPAFLLGPVLFPPAAGGPTPTAAQLPFFLFLAIGDALLLGLGGLLPPLRLPLDAPGVPGLEGEGVGIAGVVLALSFISLVTSRTPQEPTGRQEASEEGPLADGGPAVAPEGK